MSFSIKSTICHNSPLSLSDDFKLAICTEEGLYICEIRADARYTQPHTFIHKHVIPVAQEVCQFKTAKTRENLQEQLNHSDLFHLMLDRTLSPSISSNQSYRGYHSASWSPAGADLLQRSVLAALTMDHRLSVFSLGKSERKWYKVVELSAEYQIQLKSGDFKTVGMNKRNVRAQSQLLEDYRQQLYSLAAVGMTWSQVYTFKEINTNRPPSCKQPRLQNQASSTTLRFTYLFVLMKNGNVAVWKVKFPCQDRSDFTLAKLIRSDTSGPISICWCNWDENSGVLVIGSTPGRVVGYGVHIEEDTVTVGDGVVMWPDEDKLAVSHLVWLKQDKILAVSKGVYLIAFQMSLEKSDIQTVYLKNKKHSTGNSKSFISSMVTSGSKIYLSCMDGTVQSLNFNIVPDDIIFDYHKFSFHEVSGLWKCHGLCVSPNQVFTITCDSPAFTYDHLVLKEPIKMNFSKMKTEEEVVSQMLDIIRKNPDGTLKNIMDFLECIRQFRYQSDSLHDKLNELLVNDPHLEDKHIFLLRVIRYLTVMEQARKQSEKKTSKTGTEIPANISTVTAENVEKAIFLHHIQTALCSFLKGNLKLQQKEAVSLFLMCSLVEENNCMNSLNLRKMVTQAKQRAGKIKEACLICDQPLSVEKFSKTECPNGHLYARCCQTFLACQEVPYRKCTTCHHMSISKPDTALQWFSEIVKDNCIFCESLLVT